MKRKVLSLFFVLSLSMAFIACGGGESTDSNDSESDNGDINKEFVIKCDNQIIYNGPDEDEGGIVNAKVSEIQGFETYYAVWSDDEVKLLEEKDGWVKIEMVSGPNEVTGWIPEDCLDR